MRLARWLGWLLPRSEREFVLGDLEELYAARPSRYVWELFRAALACRGQQRSRLLPAGFPSRRGDSRMNTLLNDLRYGTRQLLLRPGFTALAVLTLALGIGATTAIFSVVNPILFQPLPYPNPDRIVKVSERAPDGGDAGTGYATFADLKTMARSFDALAVAASWTPTLQGSGDAERLNGTRVSGDFFTVFGVRMALGRDFTPDEQIRGKHRVTILSYGLWQRRFGGDRSVLGKPVTFDGYQYVVVGVLPQRFENLISPTTVVWAPLAYDVSLPFACRTCHHLQEFGRLRAGVAPAAALRELDLISARLVAQYPSEYAAPGMLVIPLQENLVAGVKPALLALLGAVGFVLLIACANVSSLLLGRSLQREGEFAIRAALGARRGRVVRQLLTESVLLALVGGAAGLGLAWLGVRGLARIAPAGLPRLQAIGINATVLGFTAGISLLTGLLFGLFPAFAIARPDLFTALRPGGKQTAQRSKRVVRAGLVAVEVALAVMLLSGAGLLLRSLENLLAVDPGFDIRKLLTLQVQTTGARYREDAPTWAYWEQALAAVRAVPGVELAAWTSQLPLGGNFDRYGVQIQSKPLANREEAPSADRFSVTPEYLQTMRIPLKRGRGFTAADVRTAAPVVLINETFASLSWGGADPIGVKVQMGGPDQPWRTVVGIVGNVHHTGLDEVRAPQIYLPEVQGQFADGAMDLAVRTRGDPTGLAASVIHALRSVDATLPILNVASMDDVVAATAQQRRFTLLLFQVFSVVALLLAGAGIYGVLAGSVTERTREIGIRSALGAPRAGLLALVVRYGLGLTLAGMAVGTAGALGLTRFLQKMLFGVGARDPLTFGGVALVLLAVAACACLAPALRATRVSPLEALRSE